MSDMDRILAAIENLRFAVGLVGERDEALLLASEETIVAECSGSTGTCTGCDSIGPKFERRSRGTSDDEI